MSDSQHPDLVSQGRAVLEGMTEAPWFAVGTRVMKPECDLFDWAYDDLPPAKWPMSVARAERDADGIVFLVNHAAELLDRLEAAEGALVGLLTTGAYAINAYEESWCHYCHSEEGEWGGVDECEWIIHHEPQCAFAAARALLPESREERT